MVVSSDVGLKPRVVARGVTQAFGEKPVLHDLDLEVAAGEFVVLIGHSGSGKSTLLRLIAGLDSPTSGEITVTGTTSLGFQEARLLPWDKVKDNVLFGVRHAGSRLQRDEIARRALREVKLEHRADAWPGTLSGGEAQRASLARALVREPDLLLLDEPSAGVDFQGELIFCELLDHLRRDRGFTQLMVSHDLATVTHHADHVICLNRKVAAEGPPRQTLTPENLTAIFGVHMGLVNSRSMPDNRTACTAPCCQGNQDG